MGVVMAAREKGYMGPMARRILEKVSNAFDCEVISLENQSHHHAGHVGNPDGADDAETHFKLKVVSDAFEGKKLLERHRMVNDLLQEGLRETGGVHALSLDLKP